MEAPNHFNADCPFSEEDDWEMIEKNISNVLPAGKNKGITENIDALSLTNNEYEENQNEVCLHFGNLLKQSQLINFNKIFTRFYKEDSSRSHLSSGLGLSIVKSLVEKMNGYVQADLIDNQFYISVVFIKLEREDTHG